MENAHGRLKASSNFHYGDHLGNVTLSRKKWIYPREKVEELYVMEREDFFLTFCEDKVPKLVCTRNIEHRNFYWISFYIKTSLKQFWEM